jgi:hypothetical protein
MMEKNGSKVVSETILDCTDLLMMSGIRENIVAMTEWILKVISTFSYNSSSSRAFPDH